MYDIIILAGMTFHEGSTELTKQLVYKQIIIEQSNLDFILLWLGKLYTTELDYKSLFSFL